MLHTPPVEGVVLRYGRLYGPGTWTKRRARRRRCMSMLPRMPRCSRSNAAAGIYNIAEDDGAVAIIERARRNSGSTRRSGSMHRKIRSGSSNKKEVRVPNPRWKIKPAGSTWGDFGPDDQLGRLNLVTPEKVKQGVAEVQGGHDLLPSMPLDYPGGSILNPRRNPPVLSPTERGGKPNMAYPLVARRPEADRRGVRRRRCC